jgi:hypothetical protein
MQLPDGLTYEGWERVGHQLSGVIDSSCWWLGDWLIFGKRHFSDGYQQAIRAAGLSYQTLRNYAWVARRFPVANRRSELTFQHHAEVASLPPEVRQHWLDLAVEGKWSTKQLRTRIKAKAVAEGPAGGSGAADPRIDIPQEHVTVWNAAAAQLGIDLRDWMVTTLDLAAQAVLARD